MGSLDKFYFWFALLFIPWTFTVLFYAADIVSFYYLYILQFIFCIHLRKQKLIDTLSQFGTHRINSSVDQLSLINHLSHQMKSYRFQSESIFFIFFSQLHSHSQDYPRWRLHKFLLVILVTTIFKSSAIQIYKMYSAWTTNSNNNRQYPISSIHNHHQTYASHTLKFLYEFFLHTLVYIGLFVSILQLSVSHNSY